MFGKTRKNATPELRAIKAGSEALRVLVFRYIEALESGESAKWCKCVWQIHPDDVHVKMGNCRVCHQAPKAKPHIGLPEDFEEGVSHQFRGVRKRLVDHHPQCPVHTKEGLLLYFFEWAGKHGGS